jgi:glutathione S-transferase
MPIKLYGITASTATQLVAMVLKETSTPFELVEVDFFNDAHKSPAFLEKQPFAEIPYIVRVLLFYSLYLPPSTIVLWALLQDDDGFILFESRAIARYIAAKAGSSLLPTDPKKRALFERAASIEAFNFHPYASEIVVQRVFVPTQGGTSDEALVAKLAATLETKLAGYERILAKSKYLAGDEITLADLQHLPYGVHLAPHGITLLEDKEKFPNVARYECFF